MLPPGTPRSHTEPFQAWLIYASLSCLTSLLCTEQKCHFQGNLGTQETSEV